MAKYEKWLGASLGLILTGNPIGGLLGFLAGTLVQQNPQADKKATPTSVSDFEVNLMVLASHLIKIDGNIELEEIAFVQNFLDAQFDNQFHAQRKQILNHCLQKEYDLNAACGQIRMYTTLNTRIQVVHFMFDLAASDGKITERENYFIFKIAGYLNVNDVEFRKIKKSLVAEPVSDIYEVLGVKSTMSMAEIRTTYRKLVLKYHPDRNPESSETERKQMALTLQKVKEAYEKIKKEKGA